MNRTLHTIGMFLLAPVMGVCFWYGLFHAIDKEMRFNENIRMARCTAHPIAGYCDRLNVAGK